MSKFDFFINKGISLKLLFNRFVLSSRSRLEAECRQCANLRACEATIRGETWKIGAADTSHNGSPPVVFVLRPVLLPLAHDVGKHCLFSIRQHVPLYGTLDIYLSFICGYLQCQRFGLLQCPAAHAPRAFCGVHHTISEVPRAPKSA